jgi:hypothetical protein
MHHHCYIDNGRHIDVHTHLINKQVWQARQPYNLQHTLTNQAEQSGSLA